MSRLRASGAAWIILLIAALLAACGGTPSGGGATQPTTAPASGATAAPEPTAPPASGQTPATGGVLRVARTAAPDSLNPGAAYLAEAFDLFVLVYDTLITTDLLNQPQPQLAKEWSVSDDQRSWTFKLHEGAMWHDGKPLTAEDVAFTFNMIKEFDSFALIKDFTTSVETIETPDPTTVIITFEQPVANWVERFNGVFILPKHVWEQFPDTATALEFENREMIGSGPFKMVEYRQGEFTRLAAVKDHYLDPPNIDEVIFRVFTNDDAAVQALRAGEVDLASPPNTVIRALQSEANIKVEIGNALSLSDIILNVTDPENCPTEAGGKCTGHPALRDVRFRQALAHATDKQQFIDVLLLGLGEPGISLVTPGHGEAFNDNLQDYAYDVARANQILDEAGYTDSDGDGVREMPGDPATPLKLRFTYPSDQFAGDGPRFSDLLSGMWKQIGVELVVQPFDADTVTSICCPTFDFDVIRWGWGAGPDPASLLYITTTEQIPTGISETGYSNPEYDALFVEQGTTVDEAKRIELLHKMQEILLRDVPYIIPYYPQNVEAYRSDRFQGWLIEPDGLLSLSGRTNLTRVSAVQ
ncbi:MAG: ABC transporter substrate-binding protein [Chloroflexi bacterium]|nr:ABC transporter substrate-binding protein [Chloroflexota bacterium]